MLHAKRLLVAGLADACGLIDRTGSWPAPLRVSVAIGCPRPWSLAALSLRLEDRWHTGAWTEPAAEHTRELP